MASIALKCLLTRVGAVVDIDGPFVFVTRASLGGVDLEDLLADIAAAPVPDSSALLSGASNLERHKWDHVLPPELLQQDFASENLDIPGAVRWIQSLGL
ncbi:hypothetical protein E4T66_18220 [Sinimarinibacterium sp. CAU 1509]|uniref:hypothetical protein n=1 Tax=Sinimarinibacterium sp. CAU 1509 TaxID=2562283 RepID=UPI0010AD5F80|nr:hypothetical protein [Sinimarinibacterium sp. CAU 1509]TJY57342.1 hypothetical protein E4T66_18220 [Sinimarinibacterium sp. CAU 1509]